MDIWKFYDITHREHSYCNPMSRARFDQLIDLLKLKRGARVVEIASGKGEFLVRLAEKYGVSGIGVDISPFFIARRTDFPLWITRPAPIIITTTDSVNSLDAP